MKDIKVPYLPRIYFDKSKEISEDYLKSKDFWGKRLPTNVEILAIKSGHPVEMFQDLYKTFGCKGTAWFNKQNNRFEIYIDNDHYLYQSKSSQFTIAEELSHIIIHSEIFKQVVTPEDRLILDQNTQESTHRVIEKQAKQVASELLLPTSNFYSYITEWFKSNLVNIVADRPANELDLTTFISRQISLKLGLSTIIIERALVREFDEMLIPKLVNQFEIKYLENSSRKKLDPPSF